MGIAHRWQVMLLTLTMQALIIGFGIYCFTFFLTPWMDSFGARRSQLMLGYSLHSLTAAILSPICGVLIDRYPPRRLVLLGVGLFCLSLVVMARSSSVIAVIASFAVIIPLGLLLAGPLMAQSLVAQAFRESQGRALGLSSLGTSIGGFVMPLVVTNLLLEYGWREIFDLVALATALVIVPATIFVLRPSRMAGGGRHDETGARPTSELLRDPSIFYLAFAYVIPASLLMAAMQNVGPLATDLSISAQQAGLIVSITALLMAGGKFAIGSMADRLPLGGIYLGLVVAVAVGMTLAAFAGGFVSLAIGVFLVGATAGGAFPLVATAAVRRFGPANFGRVLGIVMSIAGLSGVAPLLASWGREVTGSYQAPFLALATLLVAGVFCFELFRRGAPPEELPAAEPSRPV